MLPREQILMTFHSPAFSSSATMKVKYVFLSEIVQQPLDGLPEFIQ